MSGKSIDELRARFSQLHKEEDQPAPAKPEEVDETEWASEELARVVDKRAKMSVERMVAARKAALAKKHAAAKTPGARVARFVLDKTGSDAIIEFGKFRGRSVSELIKTPEGADYCRWLLDDKSTRQYGLEVPSQLQDIVRTRLGIKRSTIVEEILKSSDPCTCDRVARDLGMFNNDCPVHGVKPEPEQEDEDGHPW